MVLAQMLMNPVNVECFFLFEFGTGKDENLIIGVIEFVDSKVFTEMNAQSSQSAKPETPIQVLSKSIRNCVTAMARCYVDMLLFVPRSAMYVLGNGGKRIANAPGAASGK
jgi:hypothetical protein